MSICDERGGRERVKVFGGLWSIRKTRGSIPHSRWLYCRDIPSTYVLMTLIQRVRISSTPAMSAAVHDETIIVKVGCYLN